MDVRSMWRFAAVSLSLLACANEPEEECPNSSSFDCGGADDWWHPPRHTSYASLDDTTLVCTRTDFDTSCANPEGECCCGGVVFQNRVTMRVEPSQCSSGCIGLDEATCLGTASCFVAREDGTNTYLGCYSTEADVYTFACADHSTADGCARGVGCIALYTSTGTDAWQYTACTDQ